MSTDKKPPEDESAENEDTNRMGPAGVVIDADANTGEPITGLPAGGPHDLGRKANDNAPRD